MIQGFPRAVIKFPMVPRSPESQDWVTLFHYAMSMTTKLSKRQYGSSCLRAFCKIAVSKNSEILQNHTIDRGGFQVLRKASIAYPSNKFAFNK